jgi:Tfp pilus assembly protein PilF
MTADEAADLQALVALAEREYRAGRLNEAAAAFHKILALRPDVAEMHNNLGVLLGQQGKLEEALARFRRAVALKPNYAGSLRNLGNALRELGRLDEAAANYQRALAFDPSLYPAHFDLGCIFQTQRKLDAAAVQFKLALALKPDNVEICCALSNVLWELGEFDQAVVECERALALNPNLAQVHNNLGTILRQQKKHDQALVHYRRAVELRPDYPEAHGNLGLILTDTAQIDQALIHFDQVVALRRDSPEAHMDRARTYLMQGDFQRGWADYEWRWKCKDVQPPSFAQPQWQGEPIEGRSILLVTEQGLGDMLQFLRYARLVKERGAKVLLRAPNSLVPLMRLVPYVDEVFAWDDALPNFDVYLPLMSLPKIFETTLATIPAGEPYLMADPVLVDRWRETLASIEGFKVGIQWQGNPNYRRDGWRSIPLARFAPLASMPGVQLISLQKGLGSEQLRHVDFSVTELGEQLDETTGAFMDTAAVLKNLDLLITSDTALPHLAGGLGIATWLALPHVPDWRWLMDRDDSPWYPTMRLFRQTEFENWTPVFQRMASLLGETVAQRRGLG